MLTGLTELAGGGEWPSLPNCRRLTGRARPRAGGSAARPRLRTRYYAFLSYSHKDKELADWLHRELEKFRVPQRARRQADGERRRSAGG